MKKTFLASLILLWLVPASAHAQNTTCTTRPPGDSTNACASTAFVTQAIGAIPTIQQQLDSIGSTRGSILERGASGWQTITPGASSYVFTSNGTGADPSWQPPSGGTGLPNVSGSAQTTTATCVVSNTIVALGAAIDFVNGQGIGLEHCGTTFSGAAPTGLTVTTTGAGQGPSGSTTYSYQIACVDDNGGVGAAVTAVIVTNGNAVLGTVTQSAREVAFNHITWTTSCSGVAIWRNSASAGYHLIGVFNSAQGLGAGSVLDDVGVPQITVPWIPDTPTGTALNDRLVTTISSGAGTASIVVAIAPSNATSGSYARHDDTTALLAYLNSTHNAAIPAGTFNIEATTIPAAVGAINGAGQGLTIVQGWNALSTVLSGTSLPTGFTLSHMTVTAMAGANPIDVEISSTNYCNINNLNLSAGYLLFLNTDSYCNITAVNGINWYRNVILDFDGYHNNIHHNFANIGLEPTQATGFVLDGSTFEGVNNNQFAGGEVWPIDITNGNYNAITNNQIYNNLHEGLHISTNGSYNRLNDNWVDGGTASIDYCVSVSDDDANNIIQSGNQIQNNFLFNCGIKAIAVSQLTGTNPNISNTIITGNVMFSNTDTQASTPDVYINGANVTETFVAANTSLSGNNVNYVVEEANLSGTGIPNHTQVGASFGTIGSSGLSSLSGTGSGELTGGSTGR